MDKAVWLAAAEAEGEGVPSYFHGLLCKVGHVCFWKSTLTMKRSINNRNIVCIKDRNLPVCIKDHNFFKSLARSPKRHVLQGKGSCSGNEIDFIWKSVDTDFDSMKWNCITGSESSKVLQICLGTLTTWTAFHWSCLLPLVDVCPNFYFQQAMCEWFLMTEAVIASEQNLLCFWYAICVHAQYWQRRGKIVNVGQWYLITLY